MENFKCGHQDECEKFGARFEPVLQTIVRVHALYNTLLDEAKSKLTGQPENITWLLAASCLQEFDEILLLCGNGYGTGAVKLLRAFYERTITLSYLVKKPEKIPQFVDYTDIHWKKLLSEAEEAHATFKMDPEIRARIEENYEAQKPNFEEHCSCGKARTQMSWTKASVPTLANKVNEKLRLLCYNAYSVPTFHLHTTFWGIVHQSKITEPGRLHFMAEEVQAEAVETAFENAHVLLLNSLETINSCFELGRIQEITVLAEAWKSTWDIVLGRNEEEPSAQA